MANEIGLFGPTRAEVLAAQEAQDRQEMTALAAMPLGQQAAYASGMMGKQLGRTVGGLLGATDPALEQVSNQEHLMKVAQEMGIDMNTPEGATKLAQYAQSKGMGREAVQIGQYAQGLQKNSATILKMQGEAAKDFANAQYAGYTDAMKTAAVLFNGDIKSPAAQEYLRNYKIEYDKEAEAIAREYGITMATATPEQVKAINAKVQSNDIAKRAAGRNIVNVDQRGENAFSMELGKLDAKAIADGSALRDSAVNELKTLSQLASNTDVISGTYSGGRQGVANMFRTLGLLSAKDTATLANSQTFEKQSGDLLLGKIKALGTNPSNTDREFIAKVIPNLETSPEARQSVITYLQKRAQDVIKEINRKEEYARKNNGLRGFTPSADTELISSNKPSIEMPPAGTPLSSYSVEQLKQLRSEMLKKKGG